MFRPLVDYFLKAKEASGKTKKEIDDHLGNMMSGHYFTDNSQWALPTAENYAKLQQIMPQLNRPYESILAEFKNLRNQKELLRLQNISRLSQITEFADIMKEKGAN
jgi:site-specific DNA-methyltransferase (adenine-specific)